ncbi:ABC transporter ATP-binding protein [Paenactinomyces guangxiensis]|uniref:ABC transporter ATP-binding protein n=2 Tax=Paenactinomyces guangxiensis TaxID=1490290 RepID=A0A7W2A6L0_9BACL|nr:ABC transporter ATP-binding protein [Paenactinomyces guangxiensis]MBH8590577.1 ABC transporter ATP-binding protein [Paenactinomyces guangxiensis]
MKDLVKKFGNITAVSSVNIDVDSGEFMTLLGPSGCGKTTILSMILGILEPTSGSISFDGQVISQTPMNKRDVGMVFQNYALFPHMTVAQNVAFGLDMRKVPKEEKERRVKQVLEMVQLSDLAARFPKELSGGQQQRVALARALVIRPKVLLLDEPLSNLDAKLRKEMRIQLKRLHEEVGITTIYVTHDLEEALSLSTKVAVMSKGIVRQIGSPQEIFLQPKNHFVANFVGYGNFIHGKLKKEIDKYFVFEADKGFTLRVRKNGHHRVGDSVILTIKPENVKIVGEKEEGANCIKGKVLISDYVGSTTSYEILSEKGDILKVNVLGLEPLPQNHTINLYLAPESLLILDKE